MIKRSGMAVDETSYYGSLESFLNEVGNTLNPFVRTIINPKNEGSGLPDGGFFTKDQFNSDQSTIKDFVGTPPSRGVMEIKGTSEILEKIAHSGQVLKYLKRYQSVLVTNYYQFLLVELVNDTEVRFLETYKIAQTEKEFWNLLFNHNKLAAQHEEGLTQFLLRVLVHNVPLIEPKDVAWFLASYARDARTRIEQLELQALEEVKLALEETLGLSFAGKKGDHFFKSTLIQTIFYGVFSAWVLFNKDKSAQSIKFDWRLAGWYLKVPMIKALFDRVANPSQLGRLGLIDVLDWTSDALNRIEKHSFLERFEESEAVLYFYEPFLEAFDPELRKDLGVWYTPIEIVQYMVEKVDRTLRQDLNIKRGFADKNVYVLDPACGTGAYIVEVIKRIHKTHEEEGFDALSGEDLKEAAMKRIFGFEILPAPFVIAHLQLGLLLHNLGANFIEATDRVGIYLTNSLTGWDTPNEENKQLVAFPEMQEEKDASEYIKRDKPILVILGNPPYNAFAGVCPKEERGLVDVYKDNLIHKWGIKKFNLDELYVRFLRIAERTIHQHEKGVICYISSFTYTFKESFVVLRNRFFENFSSIYIDNLNGDSRETGKTTPEGLPDPSIFSTDYNKAGIKVGTSIGLFVKNESNINSAEVYFREYWGKEKKKLLTKSLEDNDSSNPYQLLLPDESNLYSFRYNTKKSNYDNWISVAELSLVAPFQGLDEDRKFDLIDFDKEKLANKIKAYFDKDYSLEQLKDILPGLTSNSAGFNAEKSRSIVLKKEKYKIENFKNYSFRAFDQRTCYYSTVNPLWKRARTELSLQLFDGNKFLLCRKSTSASIEGIPFYLTTFLFARDGIKGHAVGIPFKLKKNSSKNETLSIFGDTLNDNISDRVASYLIKINETDPEKVWYHVLAIGFCSQYLEENKLNIKLGYPKIPFPNYIEYFTYSSNLGKRIASLLNPETDTEGITINPTSLFRQFAVISKNDGIAISPNELSLNANWGNKTRQGVMPGTGKYVERKFSNEEYKVYNDSGYNAESIDQLLGVTTFDIFLNDQIYWKNIPSKVWHYHIGGYQVIKKWLSYREESIINRPLNKEEVREVVNMARRLIAIVLMGDDLNISYNNVKRDLYNWISE
jgi:hypothetical protein